jgi:hypothetical protein
MPKDLFSTQNLGHNRHRWWMVDLMECLNHRFLAKAMSEEEPEEAVVADSLKAQCRSLIIVQALLKRKSIFAD